MPVLEVTTNEEFYNYLIDKDNKYEKKYIFVDFYATWCGPCKRIAPLIKQLSEHEKYKKKILFVKVSIDKFDEVAGKYNITSIPSFLIFETGSIEQMGKMISGANIKEIKNTLNKLVAEVKIGEDF